LFVRSFVGSFIILFPGTCERERDIGVNLVWLDNKGAKALGLLP